MGRATKYNYITSPELISQINPENTRLREDFLTYMRSIQRSEGTINGYRNDLDIFFVWNLQFNRNKFYVDISKRDLITYQNWLLSTNMNSPARIRRLKAALSSLSNYIENILDDEYPNYRGIVRKIENPVLQPVREKSVFTTEQIQTLLDHLVEKKRYMQACAVALAVASGARKAELLRFKVSFFTDENLICGGSIWKTDKIKTKGRGLGKFINKYVLVSKFRPYFDLWMNDRKEKGIKSDNLFETNDGPIAVSTLDSWADTFSRHLGIPFYWHSLRHLCCTELAKAKLPDSVIQQYFQWASLDMVGVYKDIDADEEFGNYFGAEGIKPVEQKSLSDL